MKENDIVIIKSQHCDKNINGLKAKIVLINSKRVAVKIIDKQYKDICKILSIKSITPMNKSNSNNSCIFYMIYGKDSRNSPTYQHFDYSQALKELDRLATLNPDTVFYLLKSIGSAQAKVITTTTVDKVIY